MLADAAESALLRVNPADVALLDGKLPKNVFAAGDEGVQRGAFVLEAASTIVEDGPDLWLEQLGQALDRIAVPPLRSEEHTSELQSLMRIAYAVFCLKKQNHVT